MASSKLNDTFETPKKSKKSKKRKIVEADTSAQSDTIFATPGKGIDYYLEPKHKKSKSREEPNPAEVSTSYTDVTNDHSFDASTTERKKKKKKKKKSSKQTSSSADTQDSFVTANSSSASPQSHQEQQSVFLDSRELKEIWQIPNYKVLIERMRDCLPDGADSYLCGRCIEKMNWEDVKFEGFTGQECRNAWEFLIKETRRNQILPDALSEAENFLNNSKRVILLEMPNRPKKPHFLYSEDFWKNQKNKKKYQALSILDRTHKILEKYKTLSEDKRQKYENLYKKEMKKYQEKQMQLRSNYPSLIKEHPKKVKNKLPKPPSAVQIFIDNKLQELMTKHSQMTKKEATTKLRKKWNRLVEEKKMKWIKKTLVAEEEYMNKMQKFRECNPDSVVKLKPVLTKGEISIKEKMDGKPAKPAGSGYSLFCVGILKKLTDFSSKEKMSEAARRWKCMTDEERGQFNEKAKSNMEKYKLDMAKYIESLPEKEREKVQEKERKPYKKMVRSKMKSKSKSKSKSSLLLYIEHFKGRMASEHSELNEAEIVRKLVQEYESLSDTEKEIIPKDVQSDDFKPEQKKITEFFQGGHQKKPKMEHFPEEPKKPPSTGYQLFSSELLQSLTDIPPKNRMFEIGQRWRKLTQEEQDGYKVKLETCHRDYEKEVDRFRNNLSPVSKSRYEEILMDRNSKKKNFAAKKKKKTKTKVVKHIEQLSSDESDEEPTKASSNKKKKKIDTSPEESDIDHAEEERLESPVEQEEQSESHSSETDNGEDEEEEEEIPSAQKMPKQIPNDESGSSEEESDDFIQATAVPKVKSPASKTPRVSTPFKPLGHNSSTPLPKKKKPTKGTQEISTSLSQHIPKALMESESSDSDSED